MIFYTYFWYHSYNTKMYKYCQELHFHLSLEAPQRFLVLHFEKILKIGHFWRKLSHLGTKELQVKNTFLQGSIIALQHIKNSVWAIEKLYRKTCVRKSFLCLIFTATTETTIRGRSMTWTTHWGWARTSGVFGCILTWRYNFRFQPCIGLQWKCDAAELLSLRRNYPRLWRRISSDHS